MGAGSIYCIIEIVLLTRENTTANQSLSREVVVSTPIITNGQNFEDGTKTKTKTAQNY